MESDRTDSARAGLGMTLHFRRAGVADLALLNRWIVRAHTTGGPRETPWGVVQAMECWRRT